MTDTYFGREYVPRPGDRELVISGHHTSLEEIRHMSTYGAMNEDFQKSASPTTVKALCVAIVALLDRIDEMESKP